MLVPLTAKEAKASATSTACYSRTTLHIPEVHRNRHSLSPPRSPSVIVEATRTLESHPLVTVPSHVTYSHCKLQKAFDFLSFLFSLFKMEIVPRIQVIVGFR